MKNVDMKRAMQMAVRFATEYSPSSLAYNALSKAHHYSNVGDLDRSHSMPNTPSATGGASDGTGGRSGQPYSKNLNRTAKGTRRAGADRNQYAKGGRASYKSIFDLE
jgi:hypothetical protein